MTQLHNTVRRANEIELNWPDKRNGEVVLARVGGEMVGIHLLTQTDRTGQDRQDRKGRKAGYEAHESCEGGIIKEEKLVPLSLLSVI